MIFFHHNKIVQNFDFSWFCNYRGLYFSCDKLKIVISNVTFRFIFKSLSKHSVNDFCRASVWPWLSKCSKLLTHFSSSCSPWVKMLQFITFPIPFSIFLLEPMTTYITTFKMYHLSNLCILPGVSIVSLQPHWSTKSR